MLSEAIMRNTKKIYSISYAATRHFPIIFGYFAAANDDESLVTYAINKS